MPGGQVVSSMLHPRSTLDTPDTEPLPLYTPRLYLRPADPETSSIISEAPTYRSEAPPYTQAVTISLLPHNGATPRQGLPYRRYAPGFHARPHGSTSDIASHNYNIANWTTISSGPTSRHYENVARRRVERDMDISTILHTLAAIPTPTPTTEPTPPPSDTPSHPAISSSTLQDLEPPYSPAEDPDLVGEAAAAAARQQRLYRENCARDPGEALKAESASWDFMVQQMRGWEEREQSWTGFRRDVNGGTRRKLARRIGIRRGD